MIKVSASIMMHPSRTQYRDYLLDKLVDFGKVKISMDRGLGILDTSRRAWEMFDKDSDYHLVIQDDAVIGKNFKENVLKQIEKKPTHAFSFYFGNRKRFYRTARLAAAQGGVEMNWLSWGVAICLPTMIIPEMLEFLGEITGKLENHDDTAIAHYLKKIELPVWYPMPSLVDHRNEKSLVESDPGGGRRAYKFIGE